MNKVDSGSDIKIENPFEIGLFSPFLFTSYKTVLIEFIFSFFDYMSLKIMKIIFTRFKSGRFWIRLYSEV